MKKNKLFAINVRDSEGAIKNELSRETEGAINNELSRETEGAIKNEWTI